MKFNYLLLLCVALPHAAHPMLTTASRTLKPKLLIRTFASLNPQQKEIYREYLGKLNDQKKDEETNIHRLKKNVAFYDELIKKMTFLDGTRIYPQWSQEFGLPAIRDTLELNGSKKKLLFIEKEITNTQVKLTE